MTLDLTPRLRDPDALFAALIQAHEGLDEPASRRLDAALVLLLANHIGEDETVLEAIKLAHRPQPEPPMTSNLDPDQP